MCHSRPRLCKFLKLNIGGWRSAYRRSWLPDLRIHERQKHQ